MSGLSVGGTRVPPPPDLETSQHQPRRAAPNRDKLGGTGRSLPEILPVSLTEAPQLQHVPIRAVKLCRRWCSGHGTSHAGSCALCLPPAACPLTGDTQLRRLRPAPSLAVTVILFTYPVCRSRERVKDS